MRGGPRQKEHKAVQIRETSKWLLLRTIAGEGSVGGRTTCGLAVTRGESGSQAWPEREGSGQACVLETSVWLT